MTLVNTIGTVVKPNIDKEFYNSVMEILRDAKEEAISPSENDISIEEDCNSSISEGYSNETKEEFLFKAITCGSQDTQYSLDHELNDKSCTLGPVILDPDIINSKVQKLFRRGPISSFSQESQIGNIHERY